MSTISATTPAIPPLPTTPQPSLDQQLAWISLKMREAEFLQRVAHNADNQRRNEALVAAHLELARVQDLARQVAERQVAVAEQMLAALQQQPPAPPPPAAAPAEDVPHLVTLVSTMTSTQRQNPAAAASAARQQLAALRNQAP